LKCSDNSEKEKKKIYYHKHKLNHISVTSKNISFTADPENLDALLIPNHSATKTIKNIDDLNIPSDEDMFPKDINDTLICPLFKGKKFSTNFQENDEKNPKNYSDLHKINSNFRVPNLSLFEYKNTQNNKSEMNNDNIRNHF